MLDFRRSFGSGLGSSLLVGKGARTLILKQRLVKRAKGKGKILVFSFGACARAISDE